MQRPDELRNSAFRHAALATLSPLLIDIPEQLDGPRVSVRPYRSEDAPAVWEAIEESRAHLAPWMPWVHDHRSVDDVRAFIARARARWLLREDLTVGIFERVGGRYLGGSGLHRMDWSLRTFEIGYWIRHTAEGQGFIREAVQLLTRLAFDTLDANRVEIRMDPRNLRSRGVAEGLGYVLEGTLRRCAADVAGRPADRHVFALTPEEYRRLPWAADERQGGR
jgi:RimJ/RimL family protein N-acetyltransferase